MNGRARDQQVCPPQANKGLINQCIRQSIKQRTDKPRETGNQCQVKQGRCDPPMSDECYENWKRNFRPLLQRYISDMRSSGRIQNYKYQYQRCLAGRAPNVFVQNPNDDPNIRFWDTLPQRYVNIREICAKRTFAFGGK